MRQKLAEVATIAHVVRSFVQRLHPAPGGRHGSTTRRPTWPSGGVRNSSASVVDDCLQTVRRLRLHDAEYPIAQMYVDARAQRIYGGANEVMKDLIARAL
jgi:acyl-CoA dehydrogenase